jgi:presequence protease
MENLTKIQNIFKNSQSKILITSEPKTFDEVYKNTLSYVESIPNSDNKTMFSPKKKLNPKFRNTLIKVPTNVHFCALSYKTIPYFDKDSTNLKIVSNLINTNYLHKEIREIGGAYGTNASQTETGIFTLSSYRDPNYQNTIKVFRKSFDWFLNKKFTAKNILEAKLGIFQHIDTPLPPHERPKIEFVYEIDNKSRQERRDEFLGANITELKTACEKHLVQKPHSITILGTDENCPDEIKNLDGWYIKRLEFFRKKEVEMDEIEEN